MPSAYTGFHATVRMPGFAWKAGFWATSPVWSQAESSTEVGPLWSVARNERCSGARLRSGSGRMNRHRTAGGVVSTIAGAAAEPWFPRSSVPTAVTV